MGKAETVAKYIEEYLKGKNPESAEKFRMKDVEKQYAAIMGWRRKLRQEASTPESADVIVDYLKQARVLIGNAPEISAEDMKRIVEQLDMLRDYLTEYKEEQRKRQISELERKQEEIAQQLRKLRGDEKTLFD